MALRDIGRGLRKMPWPLRRRCLKPGLKLMHWPTCTAGAGRACGDRADAAGCRRGSESIQPGWEPCAFDAVASGGVGGACGGGSVAYRARRAAGYEGYDLSVDSAWMG